MKGVRFAEVPTVSTPFFERNSSNGAISTPGMLGQTPAQVSPDENLDWKNLAGRTPHNKKIEATKNMEMFHKQLFGGDIIPSTPAGKNKWSLEVTSTPSEKSTNVSVISPDPADDSNSSPAPLTPYKAELLFGSDSPGSVMPVDADNASPLASVAEKVAFILPTKDESARKNFPKKIQATPYLERPTFRLQTETSVEDSEDVATPNVSLQQAEKSSVYTPVVSSAPNSVVVSPIPMHNSFIVSPSVSSKNSSQLDDTEVAKSLFESPVSGSVPAEPTSEFKETFQLPEPQATPVLFAQELKKESPANLIPVVTTIDYQSSPVAASPVKVDTPLSASSVGSVRDLTSPMLLHRAGGVAKGRGPSSTAASFAATVAYITAPQPPSNVFVGHDLAVKRITPTVVSEPMGQPAVAFPTSPAVRKVVPEMQPKKDFSSSPLTVPVEATPATLPKQTVNMCNVSVQTSLMLDTIKTVRSSEANDASSLVHSPIAATAPATHFSPMFTSYFAAHPESDSEAEELENMENALDDVALMDLIGGSTTATLQSSPLISKSSNVASMNSSLNQSMRSTTSVGGARRVTISEHQRLEAEAEESDDDCLPVLLGSGFPSSTVKTNNTTSSVATSNSGVVPITHRPPVHFDSLLFLKNQQDELSSGNAQRQPFQHERSVSFISDLDVTDAAVMMADDSQLYYSAEEEDDEEVHYVGSSKLNGAISAPSVAPVSSVSLADYSTAETTMTLDQAVNDSLASGDVHLGQPRLAIQSLKRDKEAVPDMKEVILNCAAGAFTTSVLHFSNRQSRPLLLRPQTIQIRYEPTESACTPDSQNFNYFKVSPSELNIQPGEDNQLYITFSPPKGASGVYSGVVKIRSNKKSFTMLLRGEAAAAAVIPAPPLVSKPVPTTTVQSIAPSPKGSSVLESFSVESTVPTPSVVDKPYRSRAVEEIYRRNIEEAASKPAYFAMQTETLLQQRQRSLQQRIQDLKKKQELPKTFPTPSVSSRQGPSSASVFRGMKSSDVPHTAKSPAIIVSSPSTASVNTTTSESLTIAEDSVTIRQVGSSFEGVVTVRNDSAKISTVTVSSSSSFLRCFKTSYKVLGHSSVSIRLMLDGSNSDLQQMCRRIASSSSASKEGHSVFGFVSIKMDNQEFNLEVTLDHTLCQVIHQLYAAPVVASVPTPTATVYAVNAVRHDASSVMEATQLNSSAEATMDITKVDIHSDSEKRHHRRQRSGSSSDEVDESYITTSRYSLGQQQQQHRGKYSVEFEHGTVSTSNILKKEGTYAVPQKASKKEKQRVSSNGGHGVYFRLNEAQFGAVAIGSLTRTRIDLCNGTDNEVTVYLSDPSLPFVLLPVHSEIHLRPRSYVRVPLRFIPVASGEFNEQLVAQTSDGSYQTVITLSGFASERK